MSIKRSISLLNKGITANIDLVQGTDLIPIEFLITDYVLPESAMATVYCTKSDGNLVKSICEIKDNVISFQPKEGFFCTGVNKMQIRITSEEKNLYSFEQKVICGKNMASDDAEEEESQPTLVSQLLTKVGECQAQMQTHDLQDNTVLFESYDNAEEHETLLEVDTISSGSKLKDILSNITKFCNNIRYLFEFIGVLSIQEQGYLGVSDAIAKIGSKRVIEKGTTTIWNWEKYADGSCKLRGYTTISVTADSLTSWGGGFYQGGKKEVALPFLVYYASANAETNYLWSFALCSMARDVTNAAAKVVQFNIVQPVSNAIATEVIITIEGKWQK